jgi:alpha-L-rhamnosidase/Glycosyl hydrolases family 2, sugar binding domain
MINLKQNSRIILTALFALVVCATIRTNATPLDDGWQNPPNDAKLRVYHWWLNGNVTSNAITRDLEQMKAKGIGGALIVDADGSSQDGNAEAPHGPDFFSPAWRALYKHALHEADRLGLEMTLNIQSGWNLGGPSVTKEDAAKKYIWSETKISGGTNLEIKLPEPKAREKFYRDTFVVAYKIKNTAPSAPLKNWKQKALQESLQPFSAPSSAPLFEEIPATAGEQDADTADVIDLTKNFSGGVLKWAAPAGDWQILRFGYTIGDHAYVSTSSQNGGGFAVDVYSATAFENYWNKIVEPLVADAGPLAGKTLKYLYTDSWEIELANWTPAFPAEFKKRHGYDLTPWLPVLAGKIISSRAESDRFLFDYRQTLGDLAIDNHYKLFSNKAHARGMGIHCESGGPHAVPIDAQRCLGWDDAPMSEFWAWSWTHRIGDENRLFVKQPASAAHTYGHKFVCAEGFTTIGPNWQEKIQDNLKPTFDKALCSGLNRLVWHGFVCSPDETGIPGQQYFAGTHFNPEVTWWNKSQAFLSYINRCQFLMQQGLFSADALFYYGDHVPNFTQLKKTDPAKTGPGYDYDVITAEALIQRASVRDGKIVLPDGMSYRVLVLPDRDEISVSVLKKISELVNAGATVIGPKPTRAETLGNASAQDAEVQKIAGELWNEKNLKGRVIAGKTTREVLLADGVLPDCEIQAGGGDFDFIHRTDGNAEIYFIANRATNAVAATCTFRVSGKAPELWNAVTGEHKFAFAYEEKNGRTVMPLDFASCGSWFLIFRESSAAHPAVAKSNSPDLKTVQEISGAWTVHFDPKWGGPKNATFDSLMSWPTRPEPGIKFYSGTAVYEKTFALNEKNKNSKLFLDLGSVRELAEVKVNGKSCGIVWCPPWRVDVTDAVRSGENKLEIEVVNFWPNRLIGDAGLPPAQRLTKTNIRKLTAKTPLETAGLLGPVVLFQQN